jgi:hypothetical protein
MPFFEWRINISDVAAVVTILIAFWKAHSENRGRMDRMEDKVDLIHKWFLEKIVLRRGGSE